MRLYFLVFFGYIFVKHFVICFSSCAVVINYIVEKKKQKQKKNDFRGAFLLYMLMRVAMKVCHCFC